MGGTPTQTTTQSSTPTMDPAIKAALLGNMGVGDAITSGILPRIGAPSTSPAAPGGSFGFSEFGGSGPSSAPTNSGTGYVMADGSEFRAPTTFTAGFTPDQLAAFDRIRGQNALTTDQLGGPTFQGLTGFSAPTVGAQNVTAANIDATTPMGAAQIGKVDDVTSKNFTDYDFGKYATPYMSEVVDPVKAFYADEGKRAAASAVAQGRAAGALRGTSPAIAEALSRGEVSRQAGMALSPLYQDAFKTSAGLITNDANRNLTAAQGNQATQLSRTLAQAQLEQEAARKAFDAETQRASQNAGFQQQAGIANQGANLQAGIANQGAAINAAGVQAAGAAGMANANRGVFDSGQIVTQNLLGAGNQQQALDQSKIDDIIKALNIRNALVTGAVPGASGMTSTQTTRGGGAGLAGTLGSLGSLAGGIGALAQGFPALAAI